VCDLSGQAELVFSELPSLVIGDVTDLDGVIVPAIRGGATIMDDVFGTVSGA
jgi:hypothetical protein